MSAIHKRIASSPFSDRIHYLGFLDDEEYYRQIINCDIPCMVRDATDYANAGFPFKLGEYLSTGNPVVASDVGDVCNYLVNRETAYIVNPESVSSISDTLQYILEHQDEALEVGKAGRKIAEEHFDKTSLGNRLLQFLHAL